jgi:hypothetical protein
MKLETLALAKLTVVKGIHVQVISISREEYIDMLNTRQHKWRNLIHIELELDKAISVDIKGPGSK